MDRRRHVQKTELELDVDSGVVFNVILRLNYTAIVSVRDEGARRIGWRWERQWE